MLKCIALIVIFAQLPHKTHELSRCVPNTSFLLNNIRCYCHEGHWNNEYCDSISRRHRCTVGHIIKHGCLVCTCEIDGNYLCNNASCVTKTTSVFNTNIRELTDYGSRCTPFQSYYINCSLCVCSASGRTADAQCAVDVSCPFPQNVETSKDISNILKLSYCIPNVIYLFPCLQCMCSEEGIFKFGNCIQKCYRETTLPMRRCIPGTLYRIKCSICRCPDNSIPDEKLCEKVDCSKKSIQPNIVHLRNGIQKCDPYTFTTPICLFCDCNADGIINEHACLELNCTKMTNFQYHYSSRKVCSPGELIPICLECFCFPNGLSNVKYCTRICSNHNKLHIIEKYLNESTHDSSLIDKNKIPRVIGTKCKPNSLYLDDGRYCLCPKSGNAIFKYCTSMFEYSDTSNLRFDLSKNIEIDFNISCKPSTLVEFDCNTCFCSKSGKIDPKWCTYDDCQAKKLVQESHKTKLAGKLVQEKEGTCTPGSISTEKCNFCVCPDSGNSSERVCTKNECLEMEDNTHYENFVCEPLTYYEVDCNICYCPRDGLQNLAKCTKNHCESNFLRSDYCVPCRLFSDGCNVCICPLNGNKDDKACTNHTCDVSPWNIFKLPRTLLGNHVHDNTKRSLDICFPGEEFTEGCNVCVCPELGLKSYAACESILCDDLKPFNNFTKKQTSEELFSDERLFASRARRDINENCFIYNRTIMRERSECTPGTMYIIRCRQCICPYMGNINNFCRPLPRSMYCEQAYPGFNYIPMGRRELNGTTSISPQESVEENEPLQHMHTKYHCERVGKIEDKCFMCECEEGNVLIEEHCFKSDATYCISAKPSFLKNMTVINP